MRKPRVLPVLITAALTSVLLFGGWFSYKQFVLASPLHQAVKSVPGVAYAFKPEIGQEQASVSVELSREASLRDVYRTIAAEGKGIVGNRQLHVDVVEGSDAELESIWHQAMFQVAEAMETKTYSEIPHAMEEAAGKQDHIETQTEMDDKNVYITIKNETAAKYIVLPRTPNQLGVWPNA